MGVSRSGSQAARKLQRFADDVSDLPLTQVKEVSFMVKKNVERLAPKRLRNVGKRGARIGVKYNVGNFGGEPKSKVFAYGPFQLVERPTKAHRIPRETIGRGRRQRANRKPILIPGVGWRQSARHPGTRGKYPWRRGVAQSIDKAQEVLVSPTVTLMRRHF